MAVEHGPRRPFEIALDAEMIRFERATVRVWQVLVGVGAVAGVVFASVADARMGLGLALAAASYGAFYLWLERRLGAGAIPRWIWITSGVAESSMPWVFLLVETATRGADYALGSWVPPMLFCALIVSYTVRLDAVRALASGLAGAAIYPAAYVLLLRAEVPRALADHALFAGTSQVARSISLLVGGAMGALAVLALRRAIKRADVVVREQDLFGKYRLVRKLASGGMGTVHEALYCPEGGFERRVAVKRIHPHLAEQPRFVDAFRREAELSSRLVHPNIVQVMDFGRVGDAWFLSMELVTGEPLAAILERAFEDERALDPAIAGWIGREVLAGLAHAHEGALSGDGRPLRVVHRDVCPQNVLVSSAGHVKLTDFGVARALEDGAGLLTQTFVGHVGYVAPEQAGGADVDVRADLFPVGVMLWELLAGRHLFLRGRQGATLTAVLHTDAPSVLELRPSLDPAWDAFLRRALSRDACERFASAREMLDALLSIEDARDARGAGLLAELVRAEGSLEDGRQIERSR